MDFTKVMRSTVCFLLIFLFILGISASPLSSAHAAAELPAIPTSDAAPFELPLEGATGYCLVTCNVRAADDFNSEIITAAKAGTPFTILEVGEKCFRGKIGDSEGWISKTYTMINLPDVIPSIIYDATNSYGSLFRSLGKEIPGITGLGHYTAKTWNARLDRDEFNMPVLYSMAVKIAQIQHNMLTDGNSLVLYEAFRPMSLQNNVVQALRSLTASDSAVYHAISDWPWNISWFIATGSSNHQKGFAMDCSFAHIDSAVIASAGEGYSYLRPTAWTLYDMPTAMHELSNRSARYTSPVDSYSSTAWKSAKHVPSWNNAAQKLEDYCTAAGLSPLASEWWHFNDLASCQATGGVGTGNFLIEGNLSVSLADLAGVWTLQRIERVVVDSSILTYGPGEGYRLLNYFVPNITVWPYDGGIGETLLRAIRIG